MYKDLTEEPLKNKIKADFFPENTFDYTQIGNIDFVIAKKTQKNDNNTEYFLWAEAKKGKRNILESFVQLILTIGKEKTFEKNMPPKYLGAFDAEEFAFIEYHKIMHIFSQNDFNWNVTPSNHKTKEFKQLQKLCSELIQNSEITFKTFKYDTDYKELRKFIKDNSKLSDAPTRKIVITKNNFVFVYQKWVKNVKDSIAVDWEKAQKSGIIPTDFFLADLLSENNESLNEKLSVVLKKTKYELVKKIDDMGFLNSMSVGFLDNQRAHSDFWAIYERPPKQEYWGYIIERRDLIVPQDYREIKGAFYTPETWVTKSQEYIADVLGENWQDEYYIWDCCAGTGNMLNGLINIRNTWASTLDKADVDVMLSRVKDETLPMFEDHIFQFDFLNDDFSKCPEELQEIIKDPKKREKLIIYINPPYAEASSYGTNSKPQVAKLTKIFQKFQGEIGSEALQDLFALFFIRIFKEIPGTVLAAFSTPKFITSEKFNRFRQHFKADFCKGFVCNAETFDNVESPFPIGFYILNLNNSLELKQITLDVFDKDTRFSTEKKTFSVTDKSIKEWRKTFYDYDGDAIAYCIIVGPSMQSNHNTYITNNIPTSYAKKGMVANITAKNVFEFSTYLAIRQCITENWLNNKDQFLYPNDDWKNDLEFQSDCLIFTSFHDQNRISSEDGINHWIPFSEMEVGCKKAFKSDFLYKFINGKIEIKTPATLYEPEKIAKSKKIVFSPASRAVYDAGLELWKYYHSQKNTKPDASFYDIKKYFKGDKMNTKSKNENFNDLIEKLRQKRKFLADKIAKKVYKYGFLK